MLHPQNKVNKQTANSLSYATLCQCFNHLTCFRNTTVTENSNCHDSGGGVTDDANNKVSKSLLDAL